MSALLPDLERQLDEAAARYYRRRRPPRAGRWIVVLGTVVAVVVAVVGLGTNGKTDERPATQRSLATPDDPLGNAYAILAEAGPAPDPALWREISLGLTFEKKSSSLWRVAREDGSRRIVVSTGFNTVANKRLVCVHMLNRIGAGTVCEPAAKLLASDRPWVLPIGTGPIVLAQNDVTRIWLRLADGSEDELTPRNNVVIGRGDNACFIRWSRADGSQGRAPFDGAPPERCS